MIYTYARVSKATQDTDNQMHTVKNFAKFKEWEIDEEVCEVVKSVAETRKIYDLVKSLKSGDTLIVAELSRLGRSLSDLLMIIDELTKNKVRICFVREALDIHELNPAAQFQMQIFGAFAEYERAMIRQRTKDTMDNKRAERDEYLTKITLTKKEELGRDLNKDETIELFDIATKKHPVGRPKGAKNKKSKLEDDRDSILKDLSKGLTKSVIAIKYKTNRVTLNKQLKIWQEE